MSQADQSLTAHLESADPAWEHLQAVPVTDALTPAEQNLGGLLLHLRFLDCHAFLPDAEVLTDHHGLAAQVHSGETLAAALLRRQRSGQSLPRNLWCRLPSGMMRCHPSVAAAKVRLAACCCPSLHHPPAVQDLVNDPDIPNV